MIPAKTYFSASPFGEGGYSKSMVQAPTLGRLHVLPLSRPPSLGHPSLGGFFDDVADALIDVDGLLGQLPVHLAGDFEARRDECLRMSALDPDKYKCLIKLTRDIRDAIQGEGQEPTPPAPPIQRPPTQPASEFPWVPVAIGGGLTIAAVVYAIASKGK